jgi:hypothetical protein
VIDELVEKYMRILEIRGAKPLIKLRSNLAAKWLGRDGWHSRLPWTTTLELQRAIITHPTTLERVIAHEMVHHRDFLVMAASPDPLALMRIGVRNPHGKDFLEGAAKINAVMGPGFVTVKSDQEYTREKSTKEFFILIAPIKSVGVERWGFAWAARLSPEAKEWASRKIVEDNARLVRTTDERFAAGRAKIRRFGGMSVTKAGSPEEADLRRLYLEAPTVPV